jgi:hypothetical protein
MVQLQLWTSSAGAFPASPTALPARSRAPRTRAGSGPSSQESLRFSAPAPCSSRTCQGCGRADCVTCWPTLPVSGSMRSGVCSPRPRSVLPTDATDSSSWPTPLARDWKGCRDLDRRPAGDDSLPERVARSMWPTPRAERAGRTVKTYPGTVSGTSHARQANGGHGDLEEEVARTMARRWPTPTAGDGRSSGSRNLPGSKAKPGVSLTDAATRGTSTVSRQAPTASGSGMVLNPRFVECLMGFPDGWTDVLHDPRNFASSATPRSRSVRRSPS